MAAGTDHTWRGGHHREGLRHSVEYLYAPYNYRTDAVESAGDSPHTVVGSTEPVIPVVGSAVWGTQSPSGCGSPSSHRHDVGMHAAPDDAQVGTGLAVGSDPERIAERACRAALLRVGGATPDLAVVSVSGPDADFAATALRRMDLALAARTCIGISSIGVLGAGRGVEESPAVSVWAARLPGARLRSFHLEVIRTESGVAVLGMPRRRDDDSAVLLLADPWSFPAEGFSAQSNVSLAGLPLIGGLGAGVDGPGSTRLLHDGRLHQRGAVGVMIGGRANVTTLVSQGCRPIGPPMTVTAAAGAVLETLAGRPALTKLQEVLAGLSDDEALLAARGLHLGVQVDEYRDDPGHGDFLVRGFSGGDERSGTIVVQDAVEVGTTVQFHVRDAAAATADLRRVLKRCSEESGIRNVAGALLLSGTGRGSSLFPTADHDATIVASALDAPVAGMFTGGEIAPVGGVNALHGMAAAALVVGVEPRNVAWCGADLIDDQGDIETAGESLPVWPGARDPETN